MLRRWGPVLLSLPQVLLPPPWIHYVPRQKGAERQAPMYSLHTR